MSPTMIDDPAAAVAAAICWLTRWQRQGSIGVRVPLEHRHPSECEWCDYPLPELVAWVDDFNQRDLIRVNGEIVGHRLAADFARLSPRDQRQLVTAAQYGQQAVTL